MDLKLFVDLFQSVVLAVIQGVSAWIPVSSKTQVILVGTSFFGMTFQAAVAFALALHAGDLVAALYKYRTQYVAALKELTKPRKLVDFKTNPPAQESRFLVLSIFATVVVALPAYLLLKKGFSSLRGEELLLAVGLLLLVMAAFTWHSRRTPRPEKPLDLKTTLITGAAQGLAVIPGISRSGITQSTLLLQGVPQETALRLSFLMSAPMIAAALLAFFAVEGFSGLDFGLVVLGVSVSAVVSLLTMDALTELARKIPAAVFMATLGLLCLVPFVLKAAFRVAG